MECMLRRWCVCVVFGVVAVTMVMRGAAAAASLSEEVLVDRPDQERLHQQHIPCDDPFSLDCGGWVQLCGEENVRYQGSGVEAYLKTLLKDGPPMGKEPVCTVNCFRADPVCGSNGVTYWCGVAEATCAQVDVAHEGYCDIGNGGVGANLGLHALQSLQLVHMLWLALAGFFIVVGLP